MAFCASDVIKVAPLPILSYILWFVDREMTS